MHELFEMRACPDRTGVLTGRAFAPHEHTGEGGAHKQEEHPHRYPRLLAS